MITIIILCLLVISAIIAIAFCKAASEADKETEKIYEKEKLRSNESN